jgi:hypothetical protein
MKFCSGLNHAEKEYCTFMYFLKEGQIKSTLPQQSALITVFETM